MVNLLLLVRVVGSEFNILQYVQSISNIPDANLGNFYEFFADFRNPFKQFLEQFTIALNRGIFTSLFPTTARSLHHEK